jgi:hypothetical protein
MEFNRMRFLCLAFGLFLSAYSFAKDEQMRSTFFTKLEAQEKQEHNELINFIQTSNEVEYAVFLNERLEKKFKDIAKPLMVYLVVDVTAEMSQQKKGMLQDFFSSTSEPGELGPKKVKELLDTFRSSDTNVQGLVMKDHYRSQNRVRHFQRIEVMLDESSAKLLVGQKDIIDVYVPNVDSQGNEFVTTHTPTGRIIPRRSQRIYDDSFLAKGLYKELMIKFAESNVLAVEVSFKKPEGYEYSKEWHDQMAAEIDVLLKEWGGYKYELIEKSYNYVVLRTTKKHVQTISRDQRVRLIKHKDYRSEILVNSQQ